MLTTAETPPMPAEILGTPLPVETKLPLPVEKVRFPPLPDAYIPKSANELLDALLRTPLFSSAATSFTFPHVADEAAFGYAVAYLISKTWGPSFVDPTRCSDNC